MIPLLILAAAVAATPAAADPAARFKACASLVDTAPDKALAEARAWASGGGGIPAGQCLGLAQSALGDWRGAADSFAATADLAERLEDGRAVPLWTSAGNAALAAGDAARAKTLLTRALAAKALVGPMRGEAYLDRARAQVALGALPEARTDMDQALGLVPGDPMAWLLSAALARRMNALERARHDIGEAAGRAPDEPAILLESGEIAAAAGDMSRARAEWARVRALDPGGEAARTATRQLSASGGVPAEAPRPGR
ncbi:tetratricopeptide repeat protein [Sphingomonas morindae]|uniref:Tetratricopeptide repeat protein n=1 Tax=Sphingomonas morindae TaxID=1541170 RepID=A0ABY4XBQ7_9SPHN|nr:tetratricopeptide repeat protein [Sphingomonas morindae]USI74394.1 tetratricopeptide repeat protein [Sphingomonas morindae]